jgi:hypothetical protein
MVTRTWGTCLQAPAALAILTEKYDSSCRPQCNHERRTRGGAGLLSVRYEESADGTTASRLSMIP